MRLVEQDTISSQSWNTQRNYSLFRFPSNLQKYTRNHSKGLRHAESELMEGLRLLRAPRGSSHWTSWGHWDLLPFRVPELEDSMTNCSRARTLNRHAGLRRDGGRRGVPWEGLQLQPVLPYWRRSTRQERVVAVLVVDTLCLGHSLPASALVVEEETDDSCQERRLH